MKHDDEILSDNTKIKRCLQCKQCIFWGGTNPFENKWEKVCCKMYPYPEIKPRGVIDNTSNCTFRTTKEGAKDGG